MSFLSFPSRTVLKVLADQFCMRWRSLMLNCKTALSFDQEASKTPLECNSRGLMILPLLLSISELEICTSTTSCGLRLRLRMNFLAYSHIFLRLEQLRHWGCVSSHCTWISLCHQWSHEHFYLDPTLFTLFTASSGLCMRSSWPHLMCETKVSTSGTYKENDRQNQYSCKDATPREPFAYRWY